MILSKLIFLNLFANMKVKQYLNAGCENHINLFEYNLHVTPLLPW